MAHENEFEWTCTCGASGLVPEAQASSELTSVLPAEQSAHAHCSAGIVRFSIKSAANLLDFPMACTWPNCQCERACQFREEEK